jgi:hypothetical protein
MQDKVSKASNQADEDNCVQTAMKSSVSSNGLTTGGLPSPTLTTPPTSFSTTDEDVNVRHPSDHGSFYVNCGRRTSATPSSSGVLQDDNRGRNCQTADITQTDPGTDRYPPGVGDILNDTKTKQTIWRLPVDESQLWTSPRIGPIPSPPTSPRSRSPVATRPAVMDLAQAREKVPIMVAEIQAIRFAFKAGLGKYFTFLFGDAKTLLKGLDTLGEGLSALGKKLVTTERVSMAHLQQIDLLDSDLGVSMQEADRIIMAMKRGNTRTGPLTGKSRSLRKDVIRHDLGPQMVELAEDVLSILQNRVARVGHGIDLDIA